MRYVLVAAGVVAALLSAGPTRAVAAVAGYDSAYAGESAFITTGPGASGQFQVFFANTGTSTWRKGTASQVNLAVCLEDKTTCNVESPLASWNDGSWLSSRAYSTHIQTEVAPSQLGTFVYSFKVPLTVSSGIYRFHGDLSLAATGGQIHPQGYYHEATCACP
ncbi:MAG: hypothetical protein E6I44_15015 [Chloroflexi bacterium]|nr:MAG: hypothetical protein E6I44_15015 [Chloroflexota bacterium]